MPIECILHSRRARALAGWIELVTALHVWGSIIPCAFTALSALPRSGASVAPWNVELGVSTFEEAGRLRTEQ